MTFSTERTLVRLPIIDDANDIFNNYTQDNEVTKYLIWKPHTTLKQTIEWINYCIESNKNSADFKLIIYHKGDTQAIGMIDFRFDDFQASFGYVLSRNYWNQGLMTEAMKPVLEFVYNKPTIYRIWATHDIDNIGSGKVMEKLGLQYEGILRKSILHPNISDKPRDAKIYSKVK